ncbi:MAG: hypothetical protein QY328_11220 [Anaerolineales bacterium]|nr:MAG: hypothetical protein QY328_11220 [Anaerolineales bacterium]
MPFYKSLDSRTVAGRRTAHNLRVLKFELDKTIPAKTVDSTLLLATWNIREFGGSAVPAGRRHCHCGRMGGGVLRQIRGLTPVACWHTIPSSYFTERRLENMQTILSSTVNLFSAPPVRELM